MSDQPSTRKLAPTDPELYSQYRDVDRWAVIVGISKYQDASLNLRYADRDAESLYELLLTENGGKFKPENICKLVNAEATYAKIREALYDFLDKPKREDLVLIYLACHGASNPNRPDQLYFLTHDVNLSKIAATALPMDEIDRAVKQTIRADKMIILADTCHSAGVGGAIGNRNVNQSSERMNRYLEQLSNAQDGIALLTSAEATQVARESEQWGDGHGVFTYYLLEGMRGAADTNRDGIISIGELFEYVRKEVIAATDNRQHPVIGANRYDRNLPLAITASGGEQQVTREAIAHPAKQVLNVPAIVPIPKNPIVSEKLLFSLNKRAILTAVTALSALGVLTIISRPINGTMISQPPASVISTAQVLKPAEKGTEHIKLQLVNCNGGLDCFLARYLLPNSTTTDQFNLIFENTDSTAVELLNSTAFAQGSITGYRLNDWAFTTPQNAIFPANQVTVFPLLLKRSVMPPDRYIGEVRLTLKNRNSLVLPVNMSVRSGPLMPLLVLVLGIILGNLFEHKYSQSKAREKVYQLEEDIQGMHPNDRKILLPMVHDIRKRIYQQQHEVANTQITLIQSRLAVLKQLRTLEDQLYEQQKRGNSVSEEDFEQIRIARNLLAQGQDNEATTVVSEILQSTTTQARRRAADGLNPAETDLWHVAVNLDKSARNAIAEIEKKDPLNQIEQVQQFLVSLAGFSDQMRAEATFWSVRPLLYLVLLTGLTLIGLNTRYIEKGDAFGAKPMSDYLVLLLWGLSADAASRSLSSLQGQRQ